MAERPGVDRILSAFHASLAGELIPGIVHNFANPLNGIMGRAQIMERRLKEMIGRLEKEHPSVTAEYASIFEKLRRDIAAINQESDRFFSMFRDVSDKFSALQCETMERINISRLLQLELRFADHYLDFKHGVIKEIELQDNLPEIQGPPKTYSSCLWAVLRYIHKRMGKGKGNRLKIEGKKEKNSLVLAFSYQASGEALGNDEEYLLNEVSFALSALGAEVKVCPTPDGEVLTISFVSLG